MGRVALLPASGDGRGDDYQGDPGDEQPDCGGWRERALAALREAGWKWDVVEVRRFGPWRRGHAAGEGFRFESIDTLTDEERAALESNVTRLDEYRARHGAGRGVE